MRIIHTADLHIDSKMQSNLNVEKAAERKRELILTFERMVEFAKNNGVKVIIIAGDMFDSNRISLKTKDRIFNIIKTSESIDFLYLSGNHDEETFLSQNNYDFPNLKFFKDEWTKFDYGKLKITGVNLQNSGKAVYETLNLAKDDLNIVVLHGQIFKYNLKEDYEKVNLTKLKNKNIDYLALGHIHSFEQGVLDDRGVYCYSGCLEGRGFDECGEKGFVLLDIKGDKILSDFIPFAKRTLHTIDVEITGKQDWFDIEQIVMDSVKSISKEDLIKIVLKGKYALGLDKQIEHLLVKLNDLYYHVKIKDESSLEIDKKSFEKDMSLRGEFIREVLNSELSEEEKEKIILVGLKALEGEDLN